MYENEIMAPFINSQQGKLSTWAILKTNPHKYETAKETIFKTKIVLVFTTIQVHVHG